MESTAVNPPPTNPSYRERPLTFPEPSLTVTVWSDPVVDHLGHDPRSRYVERFWLPILGPSCLLLGRRLAAELEERPDGFEIVCATWALESGLGIRGGRHGPFWRSLDRACRFGLAKRNGSAMVARRRIPPLTLRQAERLPTSLQAEHRLWRQSDPEN